MAMTGPSRIDFLSLDPYVAASLAEETALFLSLLSAQAAVSGLSELIEFGPISLERSDG